MREMVDWLRCGRNKPLARRIRPIALPFYSLGNKTENDTAGCRADYRDSIVGDMKAVQGDTGHAQLQMIADVYSHILDEDRRHNAVAIENALYQNVNGGRDPMGRYNISDDAITGFLKENPETAQKLLTALFSALPISRFGNAQC